MDRTTGHRKFGDPERCADGAARAHVAFSGLDTLWVNTGTLCNIECENCYIESSPRNDRLSYLTTSDLLGFLDEAASMGAREIAFTGGEPFMNPDMAAMAEASLTRGFSVLILTNAMAPMMRPRVKSAMIGLRERYGDRLKFRVSIDHYTPEIHERERGAVSFEKAMEGLCWLSQSGFAFSIAARGGFGQDEAEIRNGFAGLFCDRGLGLDATLAEDLIVFPEMDEDADVPEITDDCWEILDKDPGEVMCANTRMLVKRRGAPAPTLLACTLIAYDEAFEMGASLKEAARPVSLNHPHCASFCVLGGARCSA